MQRRNGSDGRLPQLPSTIQNPPFSNIPQHPSLQLIRLKPQLHPSKLHRIRNLKRFFGVAPRSPRMFAFPSTHYEVNASDQGSGQEANSILSKTKHQFESRNEV
jgi:hypothetical protein